jgi:hypothetical protein
MKMKPKKGTAHRSAKKNAPLLYTNLTSQPTAATGSVKPNLPSRVKDTSITETLLRLAWLCRIGGSESESEDFVILLFDCVSEVLDEIDESHEEDLCLDAILALSNRLEKAASKREVAA